ncbi:nicotinate-nucleotide--dimethylbenzimidazole phosphoribosyltransferase [Streptomyces sp. NPDC090442]|uniref:nicotinate-nucleotide--dimethylbenzimidazole phosphoribosyltransferase n=1 Tax=Streptomyces sp. NPDC090442 TaxID=3365962 RepID=UPI00381A927E
MTDTGQVPGQGQPESTGGHRGQPQAVPTPADPGSAQHPGDYPYLGPGDGAVEEDDLLMPGAQGAWSEQGAQQVPQPAQQLPQPQAVPPQPAAPYDPATGAPVAAYEPVAAPVGDHETGGRDSGSVDLGAVRIPPPAAPQQPARARGTAAPRRPLHMGPPVPDATGGVVRSLADRGPADAPQPAARQAAPAPGPEYLDAPVETAQPLPQPTEGQPVEPQPAAGQPVAAESAPGQPVAPADAAHQTPPAAPLPAPGQPPYVGQAYAEQSYGAAGQGPLPGPQLGQIPAHVPVQAQPWPEAPAQAAVETAVPQGPAQEAQPPVNQAPEGPGSPAQPPVAAVPQDVQGEVQAGVPQDAQPPVQPDVQDGALPTEQPPAAHQPAEQPSVEQPPAEQLPAERVAVAQAAAEQMPQAEAVQAEQPRQGAAEQPREMPGERQEPVAEAVAPEAVEAVAAPIVVDATGVATQDVPAEAPAEAGTPEAAAAPAAAQAPVGQPSPPTEAPAPAVAPAPVADAEPAIDAAQQADAVEPAPAQAQPQPTPAPEQPAADATAPAAQDTVPAAPQQPEAVEAPAAGQPPVAEPAPAPAEPAEQPAAQQPAEQPAAQQPADAPADQAPAPAPEQPQPEAAPAPQPTPEPAQAPDPEATVEATEPAATPEQPAQQPEQPVAEAQQPADAQQSTETEAEPAPADATPADDQPAAQQPVIEAPEEQPQDATGQSQPAVAAEAEARQPAAEPAQPPAAPAEAQPTAHPEAADAAQPEAPTETPARPAVDETAAPEAPAATPQIPAQATDEPDPAPAAEEATPQEPAAEAQAPAPDQLVPAEADDRPHAQDDAQFVEHADGDDAHPAESQAPTAEPEPATAPAAAYDDSERAAVHRVIRERRDIRNGFRPDPIPNEVLLRVLEAAHTAPSVGHSQPWDFVVIRSDETRAKMHELAMRQREAYAQSLPKARAKQFRELKIEAILETPVNIVVTADSTRGGRHTLGRHTQPQMAPYSSALAVENLWLAARAEGLGVGWVSFFDEREMVRELGLPEHLEVVAYLCVGYVDEFPDDPELLQAGWSKRRPLSWVVHEETYGRRALPGEDPHDLLQETLAGIRPLDAKALGEAWERQKRMTKPAGALGMLEIISAQLCGLSRKCPPPIPEPAAVAIFAGDHGVHAQGVTPWPQEVTGQMVANFLGGGAVCNAFANQVGAEVCVVDVGVAGELPATPGLLPRKVRPGTADFTQGPAMTQEDALKAIEVGIETARDLVAAGNKALLTGEMGIANTTASAALIAVYTGVDPAEVTGRGTGINDETHARKVEVVRRALELHQPDPADPIGILAALGGLEHAAMVGLILGGASLRTPVILDGVSAGAAALVARAIAPEALAACIAGHRSAEPGHVAALNKLGLRPLVDLDLRLGEGTGALLALPVVQSAARAMHEVATFDAAGVTEKS